MNAVSILSFCSDYISPTITCAVCTYPVRVQFLQDLFAPFIFMLHTVHPCCSPISASPRGFGRWGIVCANNHLNQLNPHLDLSSCPFRRPNCLFGNRQAVGASFFGGTRDQDGATVFLFGSTSPIFPLEYWADGGKVCQARAPRNNIQQAYYGLPCFLLLSQVEQSSSCIVNCKNATNSSSEANTDSEGEGERERERESRASVCVCVLG